MIETVCSVLMVVGALFMFIAGLGVLRMPDLFMRMSCATKASTLGVGFILLALAVNFGDLGITSRALATIVFVILTAPVAAHMIGRAAYMVRVPLWEKSVVDQLCDRYDRCTYELGSYPVICAEDVCELDRRGVPEDE